MDKTTAVDIFNLSIRYRCLTPFSIKHNLLGKQRNKTELFEAIKAISFSVDKGEILGIVGKNGSGKSTLLRTIAGIFSPDEGYIDLHGNTVSLLSMGVGFQKELTGRNNILLSGMLLGFTETEIREKMEEIISFADIGRFIDMPVKTYSSGMYSKLAFSITAVLKTDIILVDEVLSVGDAKFRKKSYQKMEQLISDKERTVIIVSHNLNTLKKLCTHVLWMHEGKIKMLGDTQTVLKAYEAFMDC